MRLPKAFLVLGATLVAALALGQRYTVIDLGKLPENTGDSGYDINEKGHVAGLGGPPGRGFLWKPGVGKRELKPLPGGDFSCLAYALNNHDVVVGHGDSTNFQRAIRWVDGGPPQSLGILPDGQWSVAHGINDHGQIVGQSGNAFLWSPNGTMLDLGTLRVGHTWSHAWAISNDEVVVGASGTSTVSKPFRWTRATGMVEM